MWKLARRKSLIWDFNIVTLNSVEFNFIIILDYISLTFMGVVTLIASWTLISPPLSISNGRKVARRVLIILSLRSPFVPSIPIIRAKSSPFHNSGGIEPEQLLSRFRNGMNVSDFCVRTQRAQKNKFSRQHRCHLDLEREFFFFFSLPVFSGAYSTS
jgi:hypothetical protein